MNHGQLIRIAQALGYNSITDEGLCRGFSAMWAQAVCINDVKSFDIRLQLLEKYADNPELLKKNIDDIRNLLKKNPAELTSQEEKFLEDPEQQALLEIPAFFEGIALYLNPQTGFELFGANRLTQEDVAKISPYIQSKTLEESGGLSLAFATVDQYDQDSLAAYLNRIQQKLQNGPDAAILLGCEKHSVAVRVLQNGNFQLIDSNRMNEYSQEFSSQELARKLYSSFRVNQKSLVMKTQILTRQNASPDLVNLASTSALHALVSDKRGYTVVHHAAAANDLTALQRVNFDLVDVNMPSGNESTALSTACAGGAKAAFNYLLQVKTLNKESLASAFGMSLYLKQHEFIEQIMNHSAFDPQIKNHGSNALHAVVQSRSIHAIPLAKQILEKGIDINAKTDSGNSALFMACCDNNHELVKLFLANNADPNVVDNEGRTPLYAACYNGNEEMVKILLSDPRVDPNIRSKAGLTPLMESSLDFSASLIPLLLDKTVLSMEDLKPDSPLLKGIMECKPKVQINFLKKALRAYIADRQQGDDGLSRLAASFGFGFSKTEKIDAAQALLNKLEGGPDLQAHHREALANGRLASLYELNNRINLPIPMSQGLSAESPGLEPQNLNMSALEDTITDARIATPNMNNQTADVETSMETTDPVNEDSIASKMLRINQNQ